MTFSELNDFLGNRMRMQHIYQPLLIRALVDSGGTATLRQLAQAFLLQDESRLRYYEDRIKAMPLQVLKGHGVVEERDGLVSLATGPLTYEQRARIKALCEQRLGEYVAKKGLEIWDYRIVEEETAAGLVAEAAPSAAYRAIDRERPKGASHRNPPWNREELILALDLYLRVEPSRIDATHPDVIALSSILNALPVPEGTLDLTYRNPNGVAKKLQNFRSLDPAQEGKGLSHGGRQDTEIWREFAGDRARLRRDEDAAVPFIRFSIGAHGCAPCSSGHPASDLCRGAIHCARLLPRPTCIPASIPPSTYAWRHRQDLRRAGLPSPRELMEHVADKRE